MTEKLSPNRSSRSYAGKVVPVTCCIVHWTGGTYESAIDWCLREESDVSYHVVISPKGERRQLVPWDRAAWAAGWSKSPDVRMPFNHPNSGNRASDNIGLAGGPPTPPTPAAIAALVLELVARFKARGWKADEVWRILGHDEVAVFPPAHARAGELGRKPDPQGQGWLPLPPIRLEVRAQLLQGG